MPSQHGIFLSDLKMNFRLRDFFLDFLGCIVPGSIFLFAVTLMVGGILYLYAISFFPHFIWNQEQYKTVMENLSGSLSFNLWLILTFTFFAYFTGHLLYRQTPTLPDYASFLRIRQKVINEKDDWVIERSKGLRAHEVQFPYSNLKKYLESRGFSKLAQYIRWLPDSFLAKAVDIVDDKRSKTTINKAKIRIAFFYPESTFNLIRNEAHIRLASSMWYAARYTLTLSYFILYLVIFNMFFTITLPDAPKQTLLVIVIGILVLGRHLRNAAVKEMEKPSDETIDEKDISVTSRDIDLEWKTYDRIPFWCSSILLVSLFMGHRLCLSSNFKCPVDIIFYLILLSFITLGALFAKHRIEETIHYQRVREIIYVLETGYLAKILNDDALPNLHELNEKRIS